MGFSGESEEPVFLGDAMVLRATDKALLIELEDETQFWVPKSVVHDDSEIWDAEENSKGKLAVKRWWAEKQGYA